VALLRIAKHCESAQAGTVVSGCLLGLDNDKGQVEVTNVFIHPAKGAADFQPQQENDLSAPGAEGAAVSAAAAFQTDAVRLLKNGNCDSNIVGWFQSSSLSSFVNESTVEIQFDYQTQNSNSVLIVFDPTFGGKCPVKALRLSDEYMEFHKTMRDRKSQGPATLITGGPVIFKAGSMRVFEEVPLKAMLSVLDEAFLFEIKDKVKPSRKPGMLSAVAVQQLSEVVEDLAVEKVRFNQLSQGKAPITGATRIRGEDEAKRLVSANDLILLQENAKLLSDHLDKAAREAGSLCDLYDAVRI
jgi:hypothetical protein